MQYERLSMTAEDSQFLQTRIHQSEEICRWFRMPPHMVGLKTQSSYNSLESEAINYVRGTLLPWLVSWEQECSTALLTEKEQDELYFEFLVDGLLRGDQKARFDAYRTGVLTGFMSRNEVRRLENMDPIEGLDDYLVPLNMGDANDTGETDD
jgi:HK97 family phage portal protein